MLGCSSSTDKIDLGQFQNSVYHNRFFGLTVTIPSGWTVADSGSTKQAMDVGKKLVTGKDNSMQAVYDLAEQQTVNLFMVSKHPLGAPVNVNPNMLLVAEKVGQVPGIKTGADYLFHAKRLLQDSALKFTMTQDISTKSIAGKPFGVMRLDLNVGKTIVHQTYFVVVDTGYALAFTASYGNDDDAAALDDMIGSITFSR